VTFQVQVVLQPDQDQLLLQRQHDLQGHPSWQRRQRQPGIDFTKLGFRKKTLMINLHPVGNFGQIFTYKQQNKMYFSFVDDTFGFWMF
jgi:hypothetical protein